jgi:hypothetical protein
VIASHGCRGEHSANCEGLQRKPQRRCPVVASTRYVSSQPLNFQNYTRIGQLASRNRIPVTSEGWIFARLWPRPFPDLGACDELGR